MGGYWGSLANPIAEEADDEDEFASTKGSPTNFAGSSTGASKMPKGIPTAPAKRRFPERSSSTFMIWEYSCLVFIAVYAVAYFTGKQENQRLVNAWSACFIEFFESQFAECGPATDQPRDTTGSLGGDMLFKESQSEFLFYATGRRFCQGVLVRLQLRSRHDLFARGLGVLNLVPSNTIGEGDCDTITLEVTMNPEDMEPFVFACCRKKDLRQTHSAKLDLKHYTSVANSEAIPKSLALLTDCSEVVSKVLHPPVAKALSAYTHLFHSMILSDQNTEPVLGHKTAPQKVLRFKFFLPKLQEMGELSRLIEMSIFLIDHLATTCKLSPQARARAMERRNEVAERQFRLQHESRQEELARRKAEKLRRERTAYEMMTSEQKAKYDAREEKKKAKAQKSRMKVKRI